MHGFHFLVWFLCVKSIRDTQCGYKLFTRDTAILLFSNLHVERWYVSGPFPAILGKGPWPKLGKNVRLNIKIGRN